jgi:hypothetical protein
MGTEGSMILGITRRILWISASSPVSLDSRAARRSALAFTWAFTASASSSFDGSFFA